MTRKTLEKRRKEHYSLAEKGDKSIDLLKKVQKEANQHA
jgi:hypothetical protein